MWAEILKRLPEYPTAVITGVDKSGYPFSIRCIPQPDIPTQALKIDLPAGTEIQIGRASLLFHKFNEQLWSLQSFLVRGTLKQEATGWTFYPQRVIPGAAMDLMSFLRFVLDSRQAARQYLEKRHLPRPQVPWDEITALWRDVEKT